VRFQDELPNLSVPSSAATATCWTLPARELMLVPAKNEALQQLPHRAHDARLLSTYRLNFSDSQAPAAGPPVNSVAAVFYLMPSSVKRSRPAQKGDKVCPQDSQCLLRAWRVQRESTAQRALEIIGPCEPPKGSRRFRPGFWFVCQVCICNMRTHLRFLFESVFLTWQFRFNRSGRIT
jgi:hypothetical protein